MTQEEKQVLIIDLCARLPYYTELYSNVADGNWAILTPVVISNLMNADKDLVIKPYLRPMESMTSDEKMEWFQIRQKHCDMSGFNELQERADFTSESSDWLNKKGFDYRGLIPMGLALESPDGMYNKEEPEKGSEVPIPKTVDEAVKTLAKILSKEDRDYLLENGAISMHDSLGRWIRNEWGLWAGSELKDELMNMNKGLNHPDDMSNYIIEEFIKYWNNKTHA